MSQDVVNLTTQLIQRHRLDKAWENRKSRLEFEAYVEQLLVDTSLEDTGTERLAQIFAYFENEKTRGYLALNQYGISLDKLDSCINPRLFLRGVLGLFLAR